MERLDNLYIFGGFIITGGKLDNGNPWEGMRIMIGKIPNIKTAPQTAKTVKVKKQCRAFFKELTPGTPLFVYFDEDGNVVAADANVEFSE